MATLDDAVGDALTALSKSGIDNPDVDLLRRITKSLGPSVYKADARYVACSDDAERERIAKQAEKKMGADNGSLAVQTVCDKMKGAGSQKHRAAFMYLLAIQLGAESVYD